MCGACRITVGGKTRFVCVDGPEFDGHQVDFDEMLKRAGSFRRVEQEEMSHLDAPIQCKAETTVIADELLSREAKDMDMETPLEVLTDRKAEWREELRKSMKGKERSEIERVKMPELDPVYRATTRTEEVIIARH